MKTKNYYTVSAIHYWAMSSKNSKRIKWRSNRETFNHLWDYKSSCSHGKYYSKADLDKALQVLKIVAIKNNERTVVSVTKVKYVYHFSDHKGWGPHRIFTDYKPFKL